MGGFQLFGASPEQRFWSWFEKNSDRLAKVQTARECVCDELLLQLRKVHKGLTFLFGPVKDGRREFIVSADGNRNVFPAVKKLVAAAPDIPGWQIIAFRPAVEDALTLEMNGITLDPQEMWFTAGSNADLFDLAVFVKDADMLNDDQLGGAVLLLLDHTLGEYIVETRIGRIDWHLLPPDPLLFGLQPFSELKDLLRK